MFLRRIETHPHRIERKMRGPRGAPAFERGNPLIGVALPVGQTRLQTNGLPRTPGFLDVTGEGIQHGTSGLGGAETREPAITHFCHAAEDGVVMSAKPERDGTLDGHGVQARVGDVVPAPFVGDEFLRPEQAEDFDLFFKAFAPIVKVFVQGGVLHFVPAQADAEAQASVGKHIQRGGLFGDEGGLALGEDDDAGDKFQPGGGGGEVGEEEERFDEWVGIFVGASPSSWAVRIRPQDMIVGEQVGEAQAFDGLGEIAQGAWVS